MVLNMLEERKLCDIQYGTVVSESPLKIRLNQKLILTEKQLLLTGRVRDQRGEWLIGGVRTEVVQENHLKNGEKVVMIRNQGGQSFLVVDRLESR